MGKQYEVWDLMAYVRPLRLLGGDFEKEQGLIHMSVSYTYCVGHGFVKGFWSLKEYLNIDLNDTADCHY